MIRQPWEITKEMFLADAEIRVLLEHVRTAVAHAEDRRRASARLDQLIIEALLFSGLRTSEFCRLTIADTIVGRKESVFFVRGSRSESRTVHVAPRVSSLVEEFVREVRPALLPSDIAAADASQPLVFSERRRPYERTGLYRRVKRILTDAGLGSRASVQLLRHTYGYLAYKFTGGNLLFVQRQLGHAHPMVTSVYERLVDESYENMAEQIDRLATARQPSEVQTADSV